MDLQWCNRTSSQCIDQRVLRQPLLSGIDQTHAFLKSVAEGGGYVDGFNTHAQRQTRGGSTDFESAVDRTHLVCERTDTHVSVKQQGGCLVVHICKRNAFKRINCMIANGMIAFLYPHLASHPLW